MSKMQPPLLQRRKSKFSKSRRGRPEAVIIIMMMTMMMESETASHTHLLIPAACSPISALLPDSPIPLSGRSTPGPIIRQDDDRRNTSSPTPSSCCLLVSVRKIQSFSEIVKPETVKFPF
jgi:hypothetical protein